VKNKDWLLKQLKLEYPKGDISQKGISIYLEDVPYKGISIKHDNGLYVNLKKFDIVEFTALATYLEPRIKQEDIDVYYTERDKTISYYFYKEFNGGNKGEFEKAMWTFKIIENLINNLVSLRNKILEIESN
jgi:hypothetical protein